MTYLNLLVTQIGPISVLIILNYKNYKELKQSTTLQSHLSNIPMAMTIQGNDNRQQSIGKKHALKKYGQFTQNTSCFWGSTGSNITPVMQFHEIFASTIIIN